MLLFIVDIDGTLVEIRKASGRAMRRAVEDCFHIPDPFLGIPLSGRTDRNIVEEVCRRHQLPEPAWPAFIERLAGYLKEELDRDPGRVLPGVEAFLAAAGQYREVALALGTGNFRPCAYLKLAAHRLDAYFPVGGFGEDGPTRAAVLQVAYEKAKAHYGTNQVQPLVIGDTPLDIEAAHQAGFPCLSVATGNFSAEALSAYRPDALVEDLHQAWPAILELFPHQLG